MKKKFYLIILAFVALTILVSCNSCTPSTAQGNNKESVQQDTVYLIKPTSDTFTTPLLMAAPEMADMTDTVVIVLKKEIKKMEIDTTVKIQNTHEFKKLEKTERILDEQSATIDSLLNAKKK